MTPESIVTDSEIELVHANANFGGTISKRDVVNLGVLKCASGYHQGHTSETICKEHGLISDSYKLTKRGQRYLWAVYGKGSNF